MLLSQQTTFELHALPVPTPMTLMGEQFRPRTASIPSMTMPSRARSAVPSEDEACVAPRDKSQGSESYGKMKLEGDTHELSGLAALDGAGRARPG